MASPQTTEKATPAAAAASANDVLRRSAIVAWGSIGAFVGAFVGFLVLQVVGLIIGFVVVGGAAGAYGSVAARRIVDGALDAVLDRVKSRQIAAADAPRLFNLLESLCAVTGVQMPRVSVVDETKADHHSINALVIADPSRVRAPELVVTEGFVSGLERIEMEGVAAVCVARLRSGAAESQTLVTVLTIAKPWYLTASALRRIADADGGGQAIFDNDVKGAGITRYPPGLAAAYQRMLDSSTAVAGFDPNLVRLWLADPAGESDVAANSTERIASGSRVVAPTEDQPSLHERLALLREI